MRERDDKIKTVEELLEAGLIQVATKEEELKVKSLVLSFDGEIDIKCVLECSWFSVNSF